MDSVGGKGRRNRVRSRPNFLSVPQHWLGDNQQKQASFARAHFLSPAREGSFVPSYLLSRRGVECQRICFVRKPGTWCIVESGRLDDVSSRAGCSGRIQDNLSAFEPQFMVALCSRAHLVWRVVFRQGSKLVDDDLRARSLYRGVDSLGIECARKESLSAILFESLET